MDKNNFIKILNRYTGSTLNEAEEIISLKSAYPYSQLLHTLSARVSKDHQLASHQNELQLAAIHAADRTVLKEIISYVPDEEETVSEVIKTEQQIPARIDVIEKVEGETKEKSGAPEPREMEVQPEMEKAPFYEMESDDVAGEVMRDLHKLSKLKHNFEMLLVDYADVNIKSTKKDIPKVQPIEQVVKTAPEETVKPNEESGKSKKERIIEMAKALHGTQSIEEKTTAKSTRDSTTKRKKKDLPEEIIEDIQNSKEEIEPESEKQKEQIELINQFIKTSPSISNPKDRAAQSSGDLNPIKSGEFGDNIISETLVEILIKQGKKDKAIEVLKKLIWKFPQKKAYFASQIEELKK